MKKINTILKRNRKILKVQFLTGRTIIPQVQLAQKGFDFDYHTHQTEDCRFCYEFGYSFIEGEKVMLMVLERA